MKITHKDTNILSELKKGKKPLREIAKIVDLSENTIRDSICKFQKEGILDICRVIDPDKFPGHQVVVMGIKTFGTDSINTCERLTELKSVISLSITTGRCDIIIFVFLKEEFGLSEFYSEEISKISGIESVENFIVEKSFNLKISYKH